MTVLPELPEPPPERRRPPVMSDVALRAGVSHQTVSRVINGHPSVRPETRQRVERVIAELGYRPNSAARALVTRRSRRIGVVIASTAHYGPSSTLLGLEEAARAAGYAITVTMLSEVGPESMRSAVERLLDQAVDGVVVVAPQDAAVAAVHAVDAGVPLVAVEATADDRRPTVSVDQEAGARLATQHLLDLGHVTVEHVAGPLDWLEARARVAGWRATLQAAGARVPEPLVGDWTPTTGHRAGRALAARDDVTAVFAGNDQMALGVLRAFAEAGVRVPEDVSVVGFDDVPESGFYSPPLTTVRQDFAELGRRCLAVLLAGIDGEAALRDPVPPELLLRSSTAAPPAS